MKWNINRMIIPQDNIIFVVDCGINGMLTTCLFILTIRTMPNPITHSGRGYNSHPLALKDHLMDKYNNSEKLVIEETTI